jgi:predicted GNAT family acetyltransferase
MLSPGRLSRGLHPNRTLRRSRDPSRGRPNVRRNTRLNKGHRIDRVPPMSTLNDDRAADHDQAAHHDQAAVHDPAAHQFRIEVDGHRAVLDYTLTDAVMTITHTGVPADIGGRGIAAELMRAALAVAREHHWSVDPLCSYAAAYLKKHPGKADQRHLDELLDEALDESYPASDSPSVGGSS